MKNDFNIYGLIGDFYEGNANGDTVLAENAVIQLEYLRQIGNDLNGEFLQYYRELYSGRNAFNSMLSAGEYVKESLIREIFQNIFDCYYNDKDIKLAVNFKDDNIVTFSYNEIGFTLEQVMYYLSIGRSGGDETREGRFGIGSKSVFSNVDTLTVKSRNIYFKITNTNGNISIDEIDLNHPKYKGTELTIKLNPILWEEIKDNLFTITEKRGKYINIMDICFAFNRKKVLNINKSLLEAEDRTFNIAVMENGTLKAVYKTFKKQNEHGKVVSFTMNNKNVADFLYYEENMFAFLVPFAVVNSRRASLIKILKGKYNYFSTYELSGSVSSEYDSEQDNGSDDKLSAFFISVPNKYVTAQRGSIRGDMAEEVKSSILTALRNLIREFKVYLKLDVVGYPKADENYCYFRPQSYTFGFIRNYIATSPIGKKLTQVFNENITLIFKNDDTAPFGELVKTAYSTSVPVVATYMHEDKSARVTFIDDVITSYEEELCDIENKVIYAAYEYNLGDEVKREFRYVFYRKSEKYYVDSAVLNGLTDYSLYKGFKSLSEAKFDELSAKHNGKLENEDTLLEIVEFLEKYYAEQHRLDRGYSELLVTYENKMRAFDTTSFKILNLDKAVNIVAEHPDSFISGQSRDMFTEYFVNTYKGNMSADEFFISLKNSGAKITAADGKFDVYGIKFPVPDNFKVSEILEVLDSDDITPYGDLICGKVFDFEAYKPVFSVENAVLNKAFSDTDITINDKLFFLEYDTVLFIFLGESEMVLETCGQYKVKDVYKKYGSRVKKVIILSPEMTRNEYIDLLEVLITGKSEKTLDRYINTVKKPLTPALRTEPSFSGEISSADLEVLETYYEKILEVQNDEYIRNHFAIDVSEKLHGYGGACSVCGEKMHFIDGFGLKSFKAYDDYREFIFTLYLCPRCMAVSDAWKIDTLVIGEISPYDWHENILNDGFIRESYLRGKFSYHEHSYAGIYLDDMDRMIEVSEKMEREIILSPLMALKWIADNSELCK